MMDIALASRDRHARAEVRLSLLSAAVYAVLGVHLPFFPIWLSSRGLDAPAVAAVLAALPVVRTFSTLIVARLADRTGRHGGLLVAGAAASVAVYAIMGVLGGFWSILAAVACLAFFWGPLPVLADGITFGEARRRRERGLPQLHYSWVRGWGSVSILLFMLGSGPVAAMLPRGDIIWLLTGVAALSAVVSYRLLAGFETTGAIGGLTVQAPLERPLLVALVIGSAALILSSHAFVYDFGALHWEAQGHGATFVAFAWVAALIPEVAVFLCAGRWLGGETRAAFFLVASGAGAVLRWLTMAADPGLAGILFAQALHGVSCAAAQIGAAYLLAEFGGKARLARAQGWLAAAVGGGTSLVMFLSGPLYVATGERGYLVMAALAAAGFILALAVTLLPPGRGKRASAKAAPPILALAKRAFGEPGAAEAPDCGSGFAACRK
jgi:PPP family 3-phenylpropionic acid transporter